MFHLDDDALSEMQIGIYQDTTMIDQLDNFISFKGSKKAESRTKHNCCEIFLSWESEEEYGIQRIRHGSKEPLNRAQWRNRLESGLMAKRVAERSSDIRSVFSDQEVKFKIIGWRILTIEFLKPNRGDRILHMIPAAKVTPLTNGKTNSSTKMAKTSNDRK